MNRKVFYTILGMTILCGLVFFRSGSSMAANQTGIVTASSLNVRTGAGTSYDILQYNNANVLLAKEDKVTILEKLSGWYQVSFVKDNTTLTGFVSSNYIAIEQASTAVPAPTVTPASASEPTITYRYETSYQPVSVGAKVLKKSKLYKANGKSVYKVGRKKMSLAKGKKIKVIGEKTLKGKKWFHVSFTYKKKTRKAYLQNKYVKLTTGKGIYAQIFNVKKAANIRKKKGTGSAYKKVGGKKVSIAKKTAVTIVSDVAVKSTRWYKLRFTYKGKTYTGYSNAKYVKLAKKPVTKKVAVVAMSDAQFEAMIAEDGFLEHAGYCGHYYVSPRKPVEEHLAMGQDVILEIEVVGAMKVRETRPDAVFLFILPPSLTELERRLRKRGTEEEDVIQKRVAQAAREIGCAKDYDYVVVNGELSKAVEEVNAILCAESRRAQKNLEEMTF